MTNPYTGRPAHTFWKEAVTDQAASGVDPVVGPDIKFAPSDAIATAGSCFAQHISRTLLASGYRYLVTETFSGADGVVDESFGMYPARFGNIYTARQLLQLFDRAYGDVVPETSVWRSRHGEGVVDPFRPRIQAGGFASEAELLADRERHFAAVRAMFEGCDAFIFTLGLTEAWVSAADGSVVPLAPGVVARNVPEGAFRFHNFGFGEIVGDLLAFLDKLAKVNSKARVIFTVSPVSLIATYEDRHVLVSTIASKSILRAAVDEVQRQRPEVGYFPSYEIITGPQTGARFYEGDLREVTPEGVAFVMSVFAKHHLAGSPLPPPEETELSEEDMQRMAELDAVMCDEGAIVE